MDVTPTTPKPRPTRAKSSAVKTKAPGKVPTKPVRSRKASVTERQAIEGQLLDASAPVRADIQHRIATTAYFLAAARNFEPGHELEDWLEAERRVRLSADQA